VPQSSRTSRIPRPLPRSARLVFHVDVGRPAKEELHHREVARGRGKEQGRAHGLPQVDSSTRCRPWGARIQLWDEPSFGVSGTVGPAHSFKFEAEIRQVKKGRTRTTG
jgi:hypothetical protein